MASTGDRWVVGNETGVRFPADASALRDGGIGFLTAAFHAYGALASDNRVVDVTECDEVGGAVPDARCS
jgi:hypothetical protein